MIEAPFHLLFAFAGGVAAWVAIHMLVRRVSARRRRDLEAKAPRPALIALHYGENPNRASLTESSPGIGLLVTCALLVLRPGIEAWEYYVWGGFALLGLPGAWVELHDYARELTVGPAIAAYEDGLYLNGWRKSEFLPWAQVAFAYSDPRDISGYVADEQKAVLHIESRSGRTWSYSSRDFPLGTPAEFNRLIELVILRTAPSNTMLTSGAL